MVTGPLALLVASLLASPVGAAPTPPSAGRIQAPTTLTAPQKRDLTALRVRIGSDALLRLQQQARSMTASISRVADARARRGRRLDPARPPAALRRQLARMVRSHASTTGERDVNRVIHDVMTGALSAAEADLARIAAKLQALLAAKARLREDMAELRDVMEEGQFPTEVAYTLHTVDADQQVVSVERSVTITSIDEAQALLDRLESQLQTMTDIGEELNLRLQDAMQKQQQAMAILSAIMKNQHDTLKSIIQNLR